MNFRRGQPNPVSINARPLDSRPDRSVDRRIRAGKPLTVAYSGGTAFNFPNDVPHFDTFIASARKMGAAATAAKASVLMSNHSEFDNAVTKIKMMSARKPGEAHPFDIGAEAVSRYFKVTDECAQVARLKLLRKS